MVVVKIIAVIKLVNWQKISEKAVLVELNS